MREGCKERILDVESARATDKSDAGHRQKMHDASPFAPLTSSLMSQGKGFDSDPNEPGAETETPARNEGKQRANRVSGTRDSFA